MADKPCPAPDFDDWSKWDLVESFALHWRLRAGKLAASPIFDLYPRLRGEGEQETRVGEIYRYRYSLRRVISGGELVIWGRKVIRYWGFAKDGPKNLHIAIYINDHWENLKISGNRHKIRPEFSEDRTHRLTCLYFDIFRGDGSLDGSVKLEPPRKNLEEVDDE